MKKLIEEIQNLICAKSYGLIFWCYLSENWKTESSPYYQVSCENFK